MWHFQLLMKYNCFWYKFNIRNKRWKIYQSPNGEYMQRQRYVSKLVKNKYSIYSNLSEYVFSHQGTMPLVQQYYIFSILLLNILFQSIYILGNICSIHFGIPWGSFSFIQKLIWFEPLHTTPYFVAFMTPTYCVII